MNKQDNKNNLIYVPALLTGIESPIRNYIKPEHWAGLYKNKYDPAWFTPQSIFVHPHVLISYYYSGKIDNYRKELRILDEVTLWADSGGYSIFTQGGEVNPQKVLAWQEKNCDHAFSLDIPPATSTNVTRISPGKVEYYPIDEMEKNAAISRENNLAFQKYRTSDKLKIYNVIHGYNKETFNMWWDYVASDIKFEGYATGAKPASNVLLQAMCIMFLYDKGVRERVHLLGVSGINVIPLIAWCSKYINKISFDSTSYGYGARTRAYVYPERIRDYTHFGKKYATKKKQMEKIYCNCPICIDFEDCSYFLKNDYTWPGLLLSLHNLWAVKRYVEKLNISIKENRIDIFRELVKNNTGSPDDVYHAINFVEDCIKIGFDKAYDMYFQDHQLDKPKYRARKLLCKSNLATT